MVHLSVRLKYLLTKIKCSFTPKNIKLINNFLKYALQFKMLFSNSFTIKIKMDLMNKWRIVEIKNELLLSYRNER
jgi:hypothetical protein